MCESSYDQDLSPHYWCATSLSYGEKELELLTWTVASSLAPHKQSFLAYFLPFSWEGWTCGVFYSCSLGFCTRDAAHDFPKSPGVLNGDRGLPLPQTVPGKLMNAKEEVGGQEWGVEWLTICTSWVSTLHLALPHSALTTPII